MEQHVRILLVEDESHIIETVKANLEFENYEVVCAPDGKKALKLFKEQRFNVVLLDIMLPEVDGYAVCEQIRLDDTHTPILFLTARDGTSERISGLEKGADDYLTKPFNTQELMLRVKNLVKRSLVSNGLQSKPKTYKFGNTELNFSTFQAHRDGKVIDLTKKEARLLRLFTECNNQVVSRSKILEVVWGYDVYPSTRTIDNFILAFRKNFEEDPKNPKHFLSVRGVGYKFTKEPAI